jgi:hypothetical protein
MTSLDLMRKRFRMRAENAGGKRMKGHLIAVAVLVALATPAGAQLNLNSRG